MLLPHQPVTLNVKQIGDLSNNLAALRHDVNNNLALLVAAVEIVRRKPESADRIWGGVADRPEKISRAIDQFSRELDEALGITRPRWDGGARPK